MSDENALACLIYEAMHAGWNVTPWHDLGTGQDVYLRAARAVMSSVGDVARERDEILEAAKRARVALGQASQGVWVDGAIHEVRGAREGWGDLRDAIAKITGEDSR